MVYNAETKSNAARPTQNNLPGGFPKALAFANAALKMAKSTQRAPVHAARRVGCVATRALAKNSATQRGGCSCSALRWPVTQRSQRNAEHERGVKQQYCFSLYRIVSNQSCRNKTYLDILFYLNKIK